MDQLTGHMDYARKMKQVLDAIGIRTIEEPTANTSELQMRRTHSDVTQILMKSNPTLSSSKSDSNIRRRYSEPSVFEHLNAFPLISSNFSRRSSSLESILSRISRSGHVSINSPMTTHEAISPLNDQKSEFLNVPQ